jgi:vacuolar-type H+-ATPase subunit B/Vma2
MIDNENLSVEIIKDYAAGFTLSKRRKIIEEAMTQFDKRSNEYAELELEFERVLDFIQDRNM